MTDEPEPKDEEAPTPQKDLEQKVLKSLKQSGYPFEARIARAFANLDMDEEYKEYYVKEPGARPMETLGCLNRGVPVRCSGSYFDPTEKKSRDLDVHSIMPLRIKDTNIWIHFLVQCKDTKKIWTFGHYGMEAIPTAWQKFANLGLDFTSREERLELQMFYPDPIFAIDPRYLCSVGRVLKTNASDEKKNKDEIYEACITAINAARYYQNMADELGRLEEDKFDRRLIIFVPMVATGNKVFFADLSKDEPQVHETDLAFYVHQGMTEEGNHTHYIVPIITESSLSRIVNELVKSSIRFRTKFFEK